MLDSSHCTSELNLHAQPPVFRVRLQKDSWPGPSLVIGQPDGSGVVYPESVEAPFVRVLIP